jgi:hypothetical protein
MYEIRKDLPIPGIPGTNRKYDFSLMEVGDCMITPRVQAGAVACAARGWAARHHPDRVFISRKIDDATGGVWRVK